MVKLKNKALQAILLAFAALAGPAYPEIVRTRMVDDAQIPTSGYTTPEAAVIAATNRYNPDSVENNREHVGGIILCEKNSYFYTHGKGKSGETQVQFSLRIPKRCRLNSFWHTHGGNFENRSFFSPSDTHTVNSKGKPMYMADYNGFLYVYQPGDPLFSPIDRMRQSIIAFRKGSAKGTLISDNDGFPVRIATLVSK